MLYISPVTILDCTKAIADDAVEEAEKLFQVPYEFGLGKPELPVISRSTELTELVNPKRLPRFLTEMWGSGRKEKLQICEKLKYFIKNNICVNKCA